MPADAGREARRAGRAISSARCARRGFTLLEILLVIALLALISAALVTISLHLIETKPTTPKAIFWEAATEARKSALKHERDARLSFDDKNKQFVLNDGEKTWPVPNSRDLTIDFLQVQSDHRSSILLAGDIVDTNTIPFVTFYADGTCSPFRVQIRKNGAPQIIEIDPWTCAPVLPAKDANNP